MNPTCTPFNTVVMYAVAKRIARLSITNPAEAKRQYQAHATTLDADETRQFSSAIAQFAAQVRS